MAKKSADVTEEQEQVLDEVQATAFQPVLCGHVNRQHHNINNELEDLKCELPKGHAGDHSAEYECLRPFDGSYKHAQLKRVTMSQRLINGAVVPSEYVKVTEHTFWSDAAGTPAANIKPDEDQLRQLRQSRQPGLDGKAYEESHGRK